MKRNITILLFFFCFASLLGQNKNTLLSPDSVLKAIRVLQSAETTFCHQGMFCSQRGKHKPKADDNIFFSSLIVFTLQNVKKEMSERNRSLTDSVSSDVIHNYSYYKNQKGNNTYNFWQTNPPKFFPNSNYMSRHTYYNIPDDADCTALIYLTDTSLRNQSSMLKDKLSNHANLTTSKIKSTYHKYRKDKAYSTWFGKKMPIEFDICVQTNILYFVYDNNLKLNANDTATIRIIKSMILSGEYIKNAYFVSPSYKKPSIVLYHLARLLNKFSIPELEDCKEKIKSDIEDELKKELKKDDSFMERVILSTALIRMGGKPPPLVYPKTMEQQLNNFVFFEADLFSPYTRPSLKFISKSKVFAIPFYCKAYSLALLLEYELVSKQKGQK